MEKSKKHYMHVGVPAYDLWPNLTSSYLNISHIRFDFFCSSITAIKARNGKMHCHVLDSRGRNWFILTNQNSTRISILNHTSGRGINFNFELFTFQQSHVIWLKACMLWFHYSHLNSISIKTTRPFEQPGITCDIDFITKMRGSWEKNNVNREQMCFFLYFHEVIDNLPEAHCSVRTLSKTNYKPPCAI